MSVDFLRDTTTDTFSGDPVVEYADPKLIAFFREQFWGHKPDAAVECDQLFAWLHSFHDSNITRREHIVPLFASVYESGNRVSSTMAFAATMIFGVCAAEPWLYRRLTFHAEVAIARHKSTCLPFRSFCEVIAQHLATRADYTLRDVNAELALKKSLERDETARITKAAAADVRAAKKATSEALPKMVLCTLCHLPTPEKTAHIHQGLWIGDTCCWDEALRSTE